jgi:two-component system response regulator FixJ
MPTMQVALIDDDAAVLHSLKMLLAARGLSVGCFASAEAFLESRQLSEPASIVTDVRMPGMSGLDLHRELKRLGSAVPVILITGHGDIAMAVMAIQEGAFDFIEKPFDDQRLVDSITRAITSAARTGSEEAELADLAQRAAELSPRQREVMGLVARGLSNKEIAQALGISHRTVENYRAWAMERMGASNLADLVRKVVMLEKAGKL